MDREPPASVGVGPFDRIWVYGRNGFGPYFLGHVRLVP
jgi:hypothetical protein